MPAKDQTPAVTPSPAPGEKPTPVAAPPEPVLVTLERLDAEGRVQDRWSGEAERTATGFRFPGVFPAGGKYAAVVGRKRVAVTKAEVETDTAGVPVALVVTTAE